MKEAIVIFLLILNISMTVLQVCLARGDDGKIHAGLAAFSGFAAGFMLMGLLR